MRPLLLLAAALPLLGDTGNAVCARCHADIARRYAATPMARTSGATGGSLQMERFASATAGAARVSPEFRLELTTPTGTVARQLAWFLGSGHIGRSYLFRHGTQWFQSPLSYYSVPAKWDRSPGYETLPFLEMTRVVEPACLQCHASRVQPPSAPQPFLDAGVSCERCHGPGEAHAARPAPTNIVQPARLAPEARDSVCAQCHLTGAARIARAGKERGSFRAGERLRDHVAIFVSAGEAPAGATATSHFEKLSRSRCRTAAGDRLGCATCHSPHAEATPATYNRQCQTCHTPSACKANAGPECIGCHMPKASASLEHLVFTDHAIPRRPTPAAAPPPITALREFWSGAAAPRDTALAYATAAATSPALRMEAYRLLQAAAPAGSRDVALLAQLAQFHERMGKPDQATALWERILTIDPGHSTAAVNLGIVRIRAGRRAEAIALWKKALARNPAQTGVYLNLAVAHYQAGEREAARATLQTLLDLEPEHPAARRMLAQMP